MQHLEEIETNDALKKRLAKFMALRCFRNTKLEDLHAGTFPSSLTADYSDVKVVSPFGEIPWRKLGRFSDEEMKILMIDVVNRCYEFLSELFDMPNGQSLIASLKQRDPAPKWNDPEAREF
jgi:ligand-binding SRPBCC domain-containing protein